MDRITETLEERKNKIVERLSSEYSLNHISLQEYERLINYSHSIETEKEFLILEKIIEENKLMETGSSRTVPQKIERNFFTILSMRQTSGPITNGNFVTILGNHKIVLKEDSLDNSETVLNVMVLLGELEICVPDNVEVINCAVPLLANVSINESNETTGSGKKLIIRGNVTLGEVKITRKAFNG